MMLRRGYFFASLSNEANQLSPMREGGGWIANQVVLVYRVDFHTFECLLPLLFFPHTLP